jgi:hypothetical protein
MAGLPKRIELFLPGDGFARDARDFLWQENDDRWSLLPPASSRCTAEEAARRLRNLADQIEAAAQGVSLSGAKFGLFSYPDKGAARFLRCEITLTAEPVPFDVSILDKDGQKQLKKLVDNRPYRAVKGIAHIDWASAEDRRDCIASQSKRWRWQRVLDYKKVLEEGREYEQRPVGIHPALMDDPEGKVRVIDGMRRMLAYLEVARDQCEIIVLVPEN